MEIEFSQMLVLFACVFLGGLVDSIAGGGGLITLPAYYAVGIPAHMALGTNKFANAIGTLTASVRFFKEKQINIKVALIAAAGALVGSPLGKIGNGNRRKISQLHSAGGSAADCHYGAAQKGLWRRTRAGDAAAALGAAVGGSRLWYRYV